MALGFKALASVCFVAVALLWPAPGWVGIAFRGAFIASLLGDVLLGGPDKPRRLLLGAAAFAVAHVLFTIGFVASTTRVGAPAVLVGLITISLAVLAASRLAAVAGRFRPLVLVYGVAVTVMAVTAVTAGFDHGAYGIILGGLTFLASDLLVARGMFGRQDALNDLLGLPLYYAAQLVLAFSASLLAGRA